MKTYCQQNHTLIVFPFQPTVIWVVLKSSYKSHKDSETTLNYLNFNLKLCLYTDRGQTVACTRTLNRSQNKDTIIENQSLTYIFYLDNLLRTEREWISAKGFSEDSTIYSLINKINTAISFTSAQSAWKYSNTVSYTHLRKVPLIP